MVGLSSQLWRSLTDTPMKLKLCCDSKGRSHLRLFQMHALFCSSSMQSSNDVSLRRRVVMCKELDLEQTGSGAAGVEAGEASSF